MADPGKFCHCRKLRDKLTYVALIAVRRRNFACSQNQSPYGAHLPRVRYDMIPECLCAFDIYFGCAFLHF